MIANNDRILALDQRGELLLIDASPDEFRLIDRRDVAEDSWAHVAVTKDQVIVRDLKQLRVFNWN